MATGQPRCGGSERGHAACSAEANDGGRAEGEVGKPLRHPRSEQQPQLPRAEARLPGPGTDPRRPVPRDAADAGPAGRRNRGPGWAQDDHRGCPQPGGRHPPRARMERDGAHRHGDEGRLRLAGAQVQVAVGGGAGDHRHAVERLPLLRPPRGAEGRPMNRQEAVAIMPRRQRCAIYTRKSSEEGLDMEFNSLDAQREACEAFVTSQKAEGWATIRERYDDGGFSGGTLERPGLKRLIQDVEAGLIDVIAVYKIDRLSRSLMDFAKLVEIFDRNQVTFVSVTQSFNTTTSMGRLTLNILLSFAQFEREGIGERIRDKVAASRKRGMWMGGHVPLGYDVRDRKLVVNEAEAATVRMIFERFVAIGSATTLAKALAAEGV